METFTPSLNWGDELITSLLWVAKAWAIAAVCILVVLALLARFTTWGSQFWRITGDYFKGRQSIPVWALLGVLLVLVMIDVRLGVLFSYQSNDQFSALQAAFDGEGAAKELRMQAFGGDPDPRRPDCRGHRPHPARRVPDAAVHHPLAGVAHPPAHRRLARRRRLLPRPVRRGSDRQSRPTHPAGHRHLHHRHRPGNQHADGRDGPNVVVRHIQPLCRWSSSFRFSGVWPAR